MAVVDVEEAGEGLSRLVELAEAGDEVVLSRGGVPVARIVRLDEAAPPRRRLGLLAGLITTTNDFDDPLPDDLIAAFEGR